MNKSSIKQILLRETGGAGVINASQVKRAMGWGNDRTGEILKKLDFIRRNRIKQYDIDETAEVIAESIEKAAV